MKLIIPYILNHSSLVNAYIYKKKKRAAVTTRFLLKRETTRVQSCLASTEKAHGYDDVTMRL